MPILLYVPKSQGGPFQDTTLTVSGVPKVVLSEKVNAPYLPTVFDGRLILCTHGRRLKPVALSEPGRWLSAAEFVQKYRAHFDYLKGHIKRIDLFICHAGHSGFGAEFAEQLRHLMVGERILITAPTAQFSIQENEKRWRVGVGNALPFMTGLSRLFLLGKFDRYESPFSMMAWGGYPKPRPGMAASRIWTALGANAANRPAFHSCQWSGFGFKSFVITPTTHTPELPPAAAFAAPASAQLPTRLS